ncbi:MAG: 50S ribosomal protein L29 [Verrucomicrobiota bacterium]|jgi:large subunit ribosomal protein L29|nr:50S ribosomal protein L29 [Verrucomicrobiota bacterium]
MAKSNFKDLTAAELAAKCRELRQELFNLRLQQATARLEKPHRIRDIRREVARGETQLTQILKKS